MQKPRINSRWVRLGTAAALPLLIAVALLSWVFASPVGSSPDDDFHLNSAWCGLGERSGLCQDTEIDGVMQVPVATDRAACFAFADEQSAACQELGEAGAPLELLPTDRGNFVNQYPPVYYAFASLFASPDVAGSALLMRAANVLLFVGLISAVSAALPLAWRPALIWPALLTLVPLGLFLVASNNPSSWSITSALTTWLAYIGYLRADGSRRWVLGILAVVGALLGAGARSDSAAYTVVAIVLGTFVVGDLSKRAAARSLLGAAIIAMIVVLNLGSRSAGVATSGFGADPNASIDGVGLVVSNLLDMPYLWGGVFGMWGLGWLDTEMPVVVWFATLCAFVAVTFFALRTTTHREKLALAVLMLALVAIPSYVLLLSQAPVGAEVQPRYILPLIIVFAGFATLGYGRSRFVLTRVQLLIVGLCVAGANVIALHLNIRRYVTGTDIRSWNLDADIEWWWHGLSLGPTAIWVIGSLSFAAAVFLALRRVDASRVDASRRQPEHRLHWSTDDEPALR